MELFVVRRVQGVPVTASSLPAVGGGIRAPVQGALKQLVTLPIAVRIIIASDHSNVNFTGCGPYAVILLCREHHHLREEPGSGGELRPYIDAAIPYDGEVLGTNSTGLDGLENMPR